jgi:hypothetical protein
MAEEIVLFPCLFMLFGFVVWTIFSTIRRYKTAKLQAGLQTKLLEKFGSGQELLAYVQSDAGKQLMESLTKDAARADTGSGAGQRHPSLACSCAFVFAR